ncbi:asparagine synthase (glutamine-hydrolyzing) [Steroidobacter agaridevorans]|nr:asparagine synthase (glutamine-hydrolyzing) [Steroidobacter agaridevorans]
MCGIAGIIGLDAEYRPQRHSLQAMIQALHHRGPDGYGVLVDGPVGLAHARLSIIDLSSDGDQPMGNEDGSIQIVFNGEIFNYLELRAELLKAGHRFKSHSDTETIVHAYEEYGERFLDKLNGQFAFVLWDRPRRRVVLARDRVGIRPLYLARDGRRLLFASEIKSFVAADFPLRLNPRGLGQTFTFWSTVGEETSFEGVRALPAGHVMVIENGAERVSRYWDWQAAPKGAPAPVSYEAAATHVRELLIDSVRLQLRADVPVGAYLSGGLDSSAIVSLIKNYTDTPLRTFSVAFEDAEFDESSYQQAMVDYAGTDHTTIRCTRQDIGREFPRLVEHAETPVLRTAPVPLMLLSGLVRQSGYKVVLTGEGADEIFGGYDLFKEAKVRRFWARQPESRARAALLTRLYPYLKHSPVGNAAFAGNFYGQGLSEVNDPFYAHLPRWNTTRRLWNFLAPDVRASLQDWDPHADLRALLPDDFGNWNELGRDQYIEVQTLLSGYLLSSQGDRVAMANSIEGRFPFLDHRVIEYLNSLPARYKLRGLYEKAILRRAVHGLLPDAVLNRVKQPYRAPDSMSFFAGGKPLDYVAELLSPERVAASGYFDPQAVARLLEKCRQGRAIGFADNMAFVGILSTMLLDDKFVRSRRSGASTVPQTFPTTA